MKKSTKMNTYPTHTEAPYRGSYQMSCNPARYIAIWGKTLDQAISDGVVKVASHRDICGECGNQAVGITEYMGETVSVSI